MMSLSGLDLALWDLLGKRLAVPVAQLLGGPVHTELPAYASLPPLPVKTNTAWGISTAC